MNFKRQKKLADKYPGLFAGFGGDPMLTLMAFGCEIGDGWYDIFADLCEKLSKIEGVVLAQVKEKFGQLRVYTYNGTDETERLCEAALEQSTHVCERCGAAGKLRGSGWYYTACDKHTKEEDLDVDA